MEEVKTSSRSMTEDVSGLVETYIEIAKADATKKAANVTAYSVAGILMVVFACFIVLFTALGLAWWFGELLSNLVAGLFIVAGIFVILLVVLIVFKEQLIFKRIRNWVVNKIYE